ncbi:MAG TPA: sensor histidine kinase, partial [Candidatus Paceibacterota bacterium]|nr:sensor histidine kinase [Candidatus Paceibacterota bacterium]
LKVEDNGLGISREDLPHIFERFYRSEQARMTTTIGTGLGLAIAKLVVNTHGGDISVKSQLGKGTVFKVSLPIKVVK